MEQRGLSNDLKEYLASKRSLVETALDERLHPRDGCPAVLLEALRYTLLGPGKRLRPILAILACEACGGTDRDALPAACAVEMVHTYSLIHDDLPAMDDDDLRRGRPSCHVKFGEALAILAGDALLTMAFELLADSWHPDVRADCCLELASAAGPAAMVGGQVDDMAWEGKIAGRDSSAGRVRLEDLESMHARKTGALFRVALRMGVRAARGFRDWLERFDAYGRCFGQAFQITDDLLDVEGDAEQTGKRVRKDAGRGKLTYPGFLGVEESRRRAERLCREAGEHLAPLGAAAGRLVELARAMLERDR